jgi:quercetin 2,3-dioxygenase
MIKPRYQHIPSSKIPVALTGDDAVKVEVVADEASDDRGTIHTRTPIFYLHFTLQPRAKVV